MYILFEGIDTCGKSTQIELLKEIFPDAIMTQEPGGTAFGQKAREILLRSELKSKRAEVLLFLADRAEHYKQVIEPNLHKLILSDRGLVSGMAYAMNRDKFSFMELLEMNRFALENKMPDKVILFEMDIITLDRRLSQKGLDEIEKRGLKYLLEVQQNMKDIIMKLGIERLYINASKSIEEIQKEVVNFIRS
ncbi:MAG: dTMP kinase [Campylobacterales bacterium]|nr:dTMP kinase [Campylobacterales bacterium]